MLEVPNSGGLYIDPTEVIAVAPSAEKGEAVLVFRGGSGNIVVEGQRCVDVVSWFNSAAVQVVLANRAALAEQVRAAAAARVQDPEEMADDEAAFAERSATSATMLAGLRAAGAPGPPTAP